MYKYFLGIDIFKDSFDFSFTDETEKVLYQDYYQMDMDDFTKLSNYLTKQIFAIKTDMKSIVNQLFPEMLKNTDIFLKSSLNLLLQAPSKRIIRNLKEKKIAKLLSLDTERGVKPKVTAKEILLLAKNSIGINNQSLEKIVISKIKQMQFLQLQLLMSIIIMIWNY